mgnify:CR=1 FL=1
MMNMAPFGHLNNMGSNINNMAANQFAPQNMYTNYQQQYFDYNLPQNIEYKFYEKFDNDIYDEVNHIQ